MTARLLHGDRVIHKNRGPGTFECYGANDETCIVRFDETGESERVSSNLVRPEKAAPQVPTKWEDIKGPQNG